MSSILNNIAAIGAKNQLAITGVGMQATIQRLTTGKRINTAMDDASGLVIANKLTSDARIDNQGQRNANALINTLQTMDGTLNEATNLLTRAAELSQQASANGAQTAPLDAEYASIVGTFNKLVGAAGGNGATTLTTALGSYAANSITVTVSSITALASGSVAGAAATIQTALDEVGARRGFLGAGQESLQSFSNVLGIQMQNKTAQLSQIQDANIAEEVVSLTKFQILNQSGISALGKANQAGQSILALLQ